MSRQLCALALAAAVACLGCHSSPTLSDGDLEFRYLGSTADSISFSILNADAVEWSVSRCYVAFGTLAQGEWREMGWLDIDGCPTSTTADIVPGDTWVAAYAWSPPANISEVRLRFSVATTRGGGIQQDRMMPFTTEPIRAVE